MGVFTGIILYLMIYWVMLFVVLPWGNKAPDQEDVTPGTVSSAPALPRLGKKFIITGFVAAAVWLTVFTLIKLDVIDFYAIGKQMSDEDFK